VHLDLATFIPIYKLTWMALFAAAAGVYFVVQGASLIGRTDALKHAPASTIRDATLGPVAISGMAAGPHTLTAPVSGNACFLYQVTVWELPPGRDQLWQEIVDETLHLPFLVQDSTGELLVEPMAAELNLHPGVQQEFGPASSLANPDAIPPRVSIFLSRHGIALGRPMRIEERTIRPDMPVFVAGTLTENPGIRPRAFSPALDDSTIAYAPDGADRNAHQPEPTIIRLDSGEAPSSTSTMSQQQKIAAALARAGIANPPAWAAAGAPRPSVDVEDPNAPAVSEVEVSIDAGSEEARNKPLTVASATESEGIPPLVLMKGPANTFVISDKDQSELVGALSWKSVAMILGGTVLAALGCYVLLLEYRFH